MNRGLKNTSILIALGALVLAGGVFFGMSAPSNLSEEPTTGEQVPSTAQEVEKDTKPVAPVSPKGTGSTPTTPVVEEEKPTLPPWSMNPFFLKSRTDLMHPSKTDWIAIGANGPDKSIELDGWRVRSTVSGNAFIIRNIVSTNAPTVAVRLGSKDVVAFVHTVGSKMDSYFAGGEYHLYFGAETVAWGKEHDTLQLVSPSQEVVDTYSY